MIIITIIIIIIIDFFFFSFFLFSLINQDSQCGMHARNRLIRRKCSGRTDDAVRAEEDD